MDKPRPNALAMIICDMVITDKKTNKQSLVNIFNSIGAQQVPFIHPRMNVFISVVDGIGDYDGRLTCTNISTDEQIMSLKCPLQFKRRLQTIDFHCEIFGLKFPSYGTYIFDFYCNEEIVISRKFAVNEVRARP